MAILEKIRKRTTVLILIIGLALFAFVISGVFTSNDFTGDKVGTTVAEVNGETISIDAFRREMENATQRYGSNVPSAQVLTVVYNQEIRKKILEQQFETLGIAVESDQIMEFVRVSGYARIPDFQDENGNFNEAIFKNAIADWKINDPLRYEAWLQDEKTIIQAAKEQLYFNLVKSGVNTTLAEDKFSYQMANDKVNLQYIRLPYTVVPDSAIQVSEKEIQTYIKKHKDEFKQEEARDIRFIPFKETPTAEDEKAVEEAITALLNDTVEYLEESDTTDTIPGFTNTRDIASFLDRNSDTKFDTIYKTKKELPQAIANALMALRIGDTYGPYRDENSFKIYKITGKKPNGAVKASHILIAYAGAERADSKITRTKKEAKAKAQKLLNRAKKENVAIATLARENSDGPSASRGGDLGYFQEGTMANAFNDFCFQNRIGTIGLVETPFGFHVIKIEDKQDVIQVATLSREIIPSEETLNTLFTTATTFEMEAVAAEPEAFSDIAKAKGYTVRPVNQLKAMDATLPGLGTQRNIVQWAFNEDTEVGDLQRFEVGDGYAIVQLTKKYKKGLISPEDAAATVIPKIRKERKAEQIINTNRGKTMQALAADNTIQINSASSLTLKSPVIPGAGREPLVVGTAFALNPGQTSELIQGETGVFKIKVTQKENAPGIENYSPYTLRNSATDPVNEAVYKALEEKAEIEDKRAVFY